MPTKPLAGKDLVLAEILDAFLHAGCLDGFDLQEILIRAGMLDEVKISPDTPEERRCAACCGDCDSCFRFTAEAQRIHDRFEKQRNSR